MSTVPVSTPQTQPNQNQPQNNNSTGSNEVQGEYHYGTWYPTNGKDNENGENDDHSEGKISFRNVFNENVHCF